MAVMTAQTKKRSIDVVQITDTHLYGRPAGTLLSMNTQETLDHVIELVTQKESNIDLILATGDIAQDATVEAYNYFTEVIGKIDAPYRWIPGNHDNAKLMTSLTKGTDASDKLVHIKNWYIVLLDTSIAGQVHGMLSESELEFLEKSLKNMQQDKQVDHCLVTLHHNPIPGSAEWMKDIGLHNGLEFFEIVKQFDKVKCVLYGHIHQALDFMHAGIRCLCSPSTCIQFKPDVINFALDEINPGYRTIRLFEDGTIESDVIRVTGDSFEVDFGSKGY